MLPASLSLVGALYRPVKVRPPLYAVSVEENVNLLMAVGPAASQVAIPEGSYRYAAMTSLLARFSIKKTRLPSAGFHHQLVYGISFATEIEVNALRSRNTRCSIGGADIFSATPPMR